LEEFDVIVVGAGTAGCMTAKATASKGLNVCLIDRKGRNEIGRKICGDAISKHHFDRLNLAYPEGEELEREILGIKVHSPDMETTFRIAESGLHGFMVNRHLFGQRLLRDALDAGAVLKDSSRVIKPVVKGGFVKGAVAKSLKYDGKDELAGKAVVDASGVSAVVRNNLLPEMGIEKEVAKKDLIICYREILKLKEPITEPGFCEIYLDLQFAPGGYYWIFPESGEKVNVGLGVAASENSPNPKKQLHDYVLSKPIFVGSSIIHEGGGFVPTRRPLSSMVGNGFVVIGDAACHVNPIHGGGMGPSMIAGMIAGEVLVEAIEKDDLSASALWPANVKYMQLYGAKQAGLDVFRIFLQGLTNEDLNHGMSYRLIKEEDILGICLGKDVRLNITEKTRRIFRGLGRLPLLKRLYDMAKISKGIKRLYQNYPPSPEGLPDWKVKVENLIGKARTLFE